MVLDENNKVYKIKFSTEYCSRSYHSFKLIEVDCL